MIGRTYSQLGELDKAEPHLQRALDLSVETLGEDARLAEQVDSLGDPSAGVSRSFPNPRPCSAAM